MTNCNKCGHPENRHWAYHESLKSKPCHADAGYCWCEEFKP